jgi:hypothetical protein
MRVIAKSGAVGNLAPARHALQLERDHLRDIVDDLRERALAIDIGEDLSSLTFHVGNVCDLSAPLSLADPGLQTHQEEQQNKKPNNNEEIADGEQWRPCHNPDVIERTQQNVEGNFLSGVDYAGVGDYADSGHPDS